MGTRCSFLLMILLALLVAPAQSEGQSPKGKPNSEVRFSPFSLQVLVPPQAFAGSDNVFHLVYEVQMINGTSKTWEINSFQVLDPQSPEKTLVKYSKATLEKRMSLLGSRKPTRQLAVNQAGVVWVHLQFASRDQVPDSLIHRLELQSGKGKVEELGGPTQVILSPPPVLGAPLKGPKWVAADACCDSHRHVRALLPVNGAFHTAQRYAIDWEQLGPENRIYKGDKFKVESYHCYGQEVLAVADGTVIQAVNNLPNQVPGKLPEHIAIQDADGNHLVQKLGPGQYALYAHMIPGSVTVQPGQQVRRGQVLGRVGNSGNTSEPHLHFHLMDGPSPLGSSGRPYVLDQFELNGQIKSTEAFDRAAAEGNVVQVHPPKFPGFHQGQYPMDQSVVKFMGP